MPGYAALGKVKEAMLFK